MQFKEACYVKILDTILEESVKNMTGNAPFSERDIPDIFDTLCDHYSNFESSMINAVATTKDPVDIMSMMHDWLHVTCPSLVEHGVSSVGLAFLSLDWSEILEDVLNRLAVK